MRFLTAIYDNKANDLVGNMVIVHRHPAAAIRMYSDAASNPKTDVGQHPEDYDLICLGTIENEEDPTRVSATYEILLTGQQWAAARAASLNQD